MLAVRFLSLIPASGLATSVAIGKGPRFQALFFMSIVRRSKERQTSHRTLGRQVFLRAHSGSRMLHSSAYNFDTLL